MNKKYNLKLDLQFRCNNSIMKFNQFDNSTSDFFMRITNGGNLVDIEKAIVVLATIKPSGKVASQFVEVKNGLVYADLKPSMKDEIGAYTAKAMLILEDERVVTDVISYEVEEDEIFSLLNDSAETSEEFTLLTDMLSRLSTIEISEEQRVINEAERILSEENRKIEEAKRVEAELIRQHEEADRAKYDATRESNENIRKINEEARISSENVRLENEANRIEQEANRVKAEQLRKDNYNLMTEDEERRRSEANAHKEAEVLRFQAETNRVNEEAKRRTTEQARVSAENTRVSNENTRKANETTRQTNETHRVEAETQRQNRYNSFILEAEANANNFENYTNNAKIKEEERKSNELNRKSQEDRRVSNEVERISNENTRKANENARIESEKQRVDAENLRKEKIVEIQSDYDSLKKVIIDENASANLQNQINQTNSQLEHIANKGTTVEVLERVTKEEIDRQIADGTIANLTIEDGTIGQDKLNTSVLDNIINKDFFQNESTEMFFLEKNIEHIINYDSDNYFYIKGESYVSESMDSIVVPSSLYDDNKSMYKTYISSTPRRGENDATPLEWYNYSLNESTGKIEYRDACFSSSAISISVNETLKIYTEDMLKLTPNLSVLSYDKEGNYLGISRYTVSSNSINYRSTNESISYIKLLCKLPLCFKDSDYYPKIGVGRNGYSVDVNEIKYKQNVYVYYNTPLYSVPSGYSNSIINNCYIKNLDKFTLRGDSSETWSVNENSTDKSTVLFRIYPANNLDKFKLFNLNNNNKNYLTTRFATLSMSVLNSNDDEGIAFENNAIKLRLNKERFSNVQDSSSMVNELKIMLTESPVEVICLLRNAQVIPQHTKKIKTFGVNTLVESNADIYLFCEKGKDYSFNLSYDEYNNNTIKSYKDNGADFLKVATYNTWGLKETKEIGEYCTLNQIDYIGLQEVNASSELSLNTLCKYGFNEVFYSPAINTSSRVSGTACITRKGMLSKENIMLNSEGYEKRSYSRTTYKHNGKEIAIYNTHLSYEGVLVCERQFVEIHNKIQEMNDEYVIIMGDLNDYDSLNSNRYPVAEKAIELGYKLCNDAINNPIPTFPGNGKAIDNIIVSSNIEIIDCYTDTSYLNKSDHYCLVAELKLT